jgi:hypothetical protein
MSNHAVKISAGSALILILVVAAIMGKKPSETSIKAESVPASNAVPTKSPSAEAMIKKTIKNEVNKVLAIAPAHLTEAERLRLSKHLELFQELDVKVLMNPSEKERYVALLSDRDIQALIKRTILTANTENIKLQNSSVEFLVSAIESNVDVSQLMKEIISDSAIESTSAPQAQRQVQAELKAELIYSWSSNSPRQVQGIEALLPGPVSQRIWSNIQYTHANNAEESLSVN